MSLHDARELIVSLLTLVFSWPVVVSLIVWLFRHRIKDLLKSLSGKIETSSIKRAEFGGTSIDFFEPKTTQTIIGDTNISAVSKHFETDSLVFRSRRFGFEISYPIGDEWVPNFDSNGVLMQLMSQQGQIVAATILAASEIDGFKPNINVIVQPVGDVTITQYLAESIRQFALVNIRLLSYEVDKSTNGASFSYLTPFSMPDSHEVTLHNVARVTLANGLAFLATTTVIDGCPLPSKIRKQLNAMLNSFEVISLQQRYGLPKSRN